MISFFTEGALVEGGQVELDEGALAHARARRVSAGEAARLLDGRGAVAAGIIAAIGKRTLTIDVTSVTRVERPSPLEVIVPVADRDRMLLAAEKCAEMQVTSWRPAWFGRSRSVSPRGEGPRFREKVVARMRSALEQSGGAWMPEVHPEADLAEVVAAVTAPVKLVLDSSGTSPRDRISNAGIALLVGPEGGFEDGELRGIIEKGWASMALGATTLRFETAIIAGVAAVRALQLAR